jgi:hypothetical protein
MGRSTGPCGTIAELAVLVGAPTSDLSVLDLCTREARAGGKMCHSVHTAYGDRREAIRFGAIAELLNAVGSPTPDVAAAADSATVMIAAGELANARKTTNEPRWRRIGDCASWRASGRFWRGFGLAWSGGEREGEDPPTVVFLTLLNAGVLGTERAGLRLVYTDEQLGLMRAAASSWSPMESRDLFRRGAGA